MIATDRFSTYWKRTGLTPEFSIAIGTGNFKYALRFEIMSHFPNKHIVDVTVANKYKCTFYVSSKNQIFNKYKLIKNIDVPENTLKQLEHGLLKFLQYSNVAKGRGNEIKFGERLPKSKNY